MVLPSKARVLGRRTGWPGKGQVGVSGLADAASVTAVLARLSWEIFGRFFSSARSASVACLPAMFSETTTESASAARGMTRPPLAVSLLAVSCCWGVIWTSASTIGERMRTKRATSLFMIAPQNDLTPRAANQCYRRGGEGVDFSRNEHRTGNNIQH